jgi:transcriptional regulator with XRE-family HTH domain
MANLGEILRKRREELNLTLRQVEESTGISNAYLSQIENQKIIRPSPSVLNKLANLYEISYNRLMGLAGHPLDNDHHTTILFRTSGGTTDELTVDEERELLDYLSFLRARRARK